MSNTNNNLQTQTSNALYNAIMKASGKDHPLMNPPYKFKWTERTIPVVEGSSETTIERYIENYKNVSQDIRNQLDDEAEAIQIILTGIDNDIYSIVDACPNACEMWKVTERLKQVLTLITTRMAKTITSCYQKRGKAIVNSLPPTYDQEPAMVADDDEMSKEKEIDKLMALISLSFKKIYKPTNNNLRTSSNTSRENQDNTSRINRGTRYDNQRVVNVAGARENVGTHVVQQSRIQCYNCKEYRHVARECHKPKHAKDATYHKEKMLLYQKLEAHYLYMAQIQEVTSDVADNSGPIFDVEPLWSIVDADLEVALDGLLFTSVIYLDSLLKVQRRNTRSPHRFPQTCSKRTSCSKGIEHQTSTARTPEQNGVVERQNRTLVEAARTMLSAAKVPLFFWAEAIATTCFTQNRSLVIPQHEKTPYHIINGQKPSVKFFHIFGSLCYIVRDGENLDKMKEKGDACIFVGYSTQSRAYRVYNKRTRVIVETIHVNFDELPLMVSDHVSSDPVPQCLTTALEQDSLSPCPQCQQNVHQAAETVTTTIELDLLFSLMFDELLNGTTSVVSKSFVVHAADTPDQRQQHNTTTSTSTTVAANIPPLNIQKTPKTTSQAPNQAPTVNAIEHINQAKTNKENA
ncbi:retrovirus-related pol polyprotein from transposon TNT 1-94 [Tanacetum coccineum]